MIKKSLDLRNGYKDPKRLEAVRKLPCQACKVVNEVQTTRTEAHHLIGFGIGKKASDLLTIPLCKSHHSAQIPGISIHATVLSDWEDSFESQQLLLEKTNRLLKKSESISINEYKKLISKKPSKYRSTKVEYIENGEKKVKDSKKEYSYGLLLKQREKDGEITNLQEQVSFVLQEAIKANGKTIEKEIKYIADYVHEEGGDKIVTDVKSEITKKNSAYILKRKMFKMRYPQYIFKEV